MTDRSPGAVLDPLGVTLDLDDDQQVTDVLIVARVVGFGEDAGTALIVTTNPGCDWITQRGLLSAARSVLDGDLAEQDD